MQTAADVRRRSKHGPVARRQVKVGCAQDAEHNVVRVREGELERAVA